MAAGMRGMSTAERIRSDLQWPVLEGPDVSERNTCIGYALYYQTAT